VILVPSCLGIDSQTTRIGVALCALDPPYAPLWAWTYSIREEGRSLGAQVREVLGEVDSQASARGLVIARVGIERGVVFKAGRDYLWDAGGVYHLAADSAGRRFGTSIPILPLRAMEWKQAALGNGHASKEAISAWAIERAERAGWDAEAIRGLLVREADGADALGIAVAAAMIEIPAAVA
jgi:hypothetical protein